METITVTIEIEESRLSTGEVAYSALCLELNVASQGDTIDEAVRNIDEAIMMFLEDAPQSEVERRKENIRGQHRYIPLGVHCLLTGIETTLNPLRVLSGREVCDILEANEFVFKRHVGSHKTYQKVVELDTQESETYSVQVPMHREIVIKTLQSIIRQSHLPRSLFETGH